MFRKLRDFFARSVSVIEPGRSDVRTVVPESDDPAVDPTAPPAPREDDVNR
ncbi:MAG: hypothetical protein IT304_07260 [Dehalococcoidia bacterium]|nr:hypothetical protein [Dehalococcoidia bacterium]